MAKKNEMTLLEFLIILVRGLLVVISAVCFFIELAKPIFKIDLLTYAIAVGVVGEIGLLFFWKEKPKKNESKFWYTAWAKFHCLVISAFVVGLFIGFARAVVEIWKYSVEKWAALLPGAITLVAAIAMLVVWVKLNEAWITRERKIEEDK